MHTHISPHTVFATCTSSCISTEPRTARERQVSRNISRTTCRQLELPVAVGELRTCEQCLRIVKTIRMVLHLQIEGVHQQDPLVLHPFTFVSYKKSQFALALHRSAYFCLVCTLCLFSLSRSPLSDKVYNVSATHMPHHFPLLFVSC